MWQVVRRLWHFNPRAPRGARRRTGRENPVDGGISIHAPREGRDCWEFLPVAGRDNFNPRAPRGARRSQANGDGVYRKFQSTRPARGATPRSANHFAILPFQSTRPARGATRGHKTGLSVLNDFNPRAPRGARLYLTWRSAWATAFQSTRPARGATTSPFSSSYSSLFQSTRPARGATFSPFSR